MAVDTIVASIATMNMDAITAAITNGRRVPALAPRLGADMRDLDGGPAPPAGAALSAP
ncbi:hypothetical protein GCM10007036_10050 [Alsobacter metallidurans]|uniref:Uncharacterized protein n=1 Tax=Alsobacter metallidurans TaxID=340221 RepID=A0A917I572_9HYPH|nr:hypothetical protein GCM10007036_10050 [Alsobacter metallidurans]